MTYWNSFDNNEIVDNKKQEIQQASVPHNNVERSDQTKLSSPNTWHFLTEEDYCIITC